MPSAVPTRIPSLMTTRAWFSTSGWSAARFGGAAGAAAPLLPWRGLRATRPRMEQAPEAAPEAAGWDPDTAPGPAVPDRERAGWLDQPLFWDRPRSGRRNSGTWSGGAPGAAAPRPPCRGLRAARPGVQHVPEAAGWDPDTAPGPAVPGRERASRLDQPLS
jgi:hypothetical protein